MARTPRAVTTVLFTDVVGPGSRTYAPGRIGPPLSQPAGRRGALNPVKVAI